MITFPKLFAAFMLLDNAVAFYDYAASMTDELMSMEHGETLTGENWKNSDGILFLCHFIYHISDRDKARIEPRPSRLKPRGCGTATN